MRIGHRQISVYFLTLVFGLVAGFAYIGTTFLKGYFDAQKKVEILQQNFENGDIQVYAKQGGVDPLSLETVYRNNDVVNSISVYRGKNNILTGGSEPSLYLDKEGIRHYKHSWWQRVVRTHIPDPVNGQDLNVDILVDIIPQEILKKGLVIGLGLVGSIFVLNLIGSALGRTRHERNIRKVVEAESEFDQVSVRTEDGPSSVQIQKKPDQPLMSMDIPLETLLEPGALDDFFSTLDELDKKNAEEEAKKKAEEEAKRKIAYAKIRGEEIPEELLALVNHEDEDATAVDEILPDDTVAEATQDFDLPELEDVSAAPDDTVEEATQDFELPELEDVSVAPDDTVEEATQDFELPELEDVSVAPDDTIEEATHDFELPELEDVSVAPDDTVEEATQDFELPELEDVSVAPDDTVEEATQDFELPELEDVSVAPDDTVEEATQDFELPELEDVSAAPDDTVEEATQDFDLPELEDVSAAPDDTVEEEETQGSEFPELEDNSGSVLQDYEFDDALEAEDSVNAHEVIPESSDEKDEDLELSFGNNNDVTEKEVDLTQSELDELPSLGSLLDPGSVAREDDKEFDDLPDLDNLLRNEENDEKWDPESILDTSNIEFKPEILDEISSSPDIGLRNLSSDVDDEMLEDQFSSDEENEIPKYSIHHKLPEPLMLKGMAAEHSQFHPPRTYKVSESLRFTFSEDELEEALLNSRWTDSLSRILLDAEQSNEDFSLLVFSLSNRIAIDLARQFFSEKYGLSLHHFSENSTGVWLMNTNLEEAYGIAGEFAYFIEENKYIVSIGLSSRSQRLVLAEDLVRESLHALLRSVYSNGGIVGFRPDASKYARMKNVVEN